MAIKHVVDTIKKQLPHLLEMIKKDNNELEKIIKSGDLYGGLEYLWGFDSIDLSPYDLSDADPSKIVRFPFSTSTIWPDSSKMPKGFDPTEILERAKHFKGLGVESLNEQGITGKGVKIAYIDKPFDIQHIEFADRHIEYFDDLGRPFDYHGSACISRLMGKNIGIAPDIDLLFYPVGNQRYEYIESQVVDGLDAIGDIISRVENGEQIRAIGMSSCIDYQITLIKDKNRAKIYADRLAELKKKLEDLGIPLIDADRFFENFAYVYKIDPLKDNADIDNYITHSKGWNYRASVIDADKCIPLIDTRDGYLYENLIGCASWSIPQVVGLYCLALQVNKNLTYQEFAEIAENTCDKNKHGVKLVNARQLIREVENRLTTHFQSTQ